MPTYEFHCNKCDACFETFSTFEEKEKGEKERTISCAKCGSNDVEQVFGGFSILTGAQIRRDTGGGAGCCGGGDCC